MIWCSHKYRIVRNALALAVLLVFSAGALHDFFHPHESIENPCPLQQAISMPCLVQPVFATGATECCEGILKTVQVPLAAWHTNEVTTARGPPEATVYL